AAQDLGDVPLDDDRRGLVEADAEELRIALDEGGQVGEAVALGEVLVDADAGQEAEAAFVALAHHLGVAQRAATQQVIALDGGAGAAAADDPAALQHVAEALVGLGVLVPIDEAPLPPAAAPDA